MGKITIAEEPANLGAPLFRHLQPIVDALLRSGNRLARSDCWGSTRDGFVCYLRDPIDFELVRSMFQLPESIVLSEARDLIACQKTWATIYGNMPARGVW